MALTRQQQKEWERGAPYSSAFTQDIVRQLREAIERAEAAEGLVKRTVDFARSPIGGMGDTTNFEVYTDAGRALIEDMEAYLTPAEAQAQQKGSDGG